MKRIILSTVAALAFASPVLAGTSPAASKIFAQIFAAQDGNQGRVYNLNQTLNAPRSPAALAIFASLRAEKSGNRPPVVSLNAPETTQARLILDSITAERFGSKLN